MEDCSTTSEVTVSQLLSPLLLWAHDGLHFCDVYTLTRFDRLCKDARQLTEKDRFWEPRVRAVCDVWVLPDPVSSERTWRAHFFSLLRPRWDGVYIGQCGYLHRVRPGTSMSSSRKQIWMDYRRYVRLCPPDETGVLRALVLQDAAPLDVALGVLLGLDPCTHTPSSLSRGALQPSKDIKLFLQSKTFPATYELQCSGSLVNISYPDDALGIFRMTLRLRSRSHYDFSERLEWTDYQQTNLRGELQCFDLGRNEHGESVNVTRDHFAPFVLRPCASLEYLL